jgi:hypothetical protein
MAPCRTSLTKGIYIIQSHKPKSQYAAAFEASSKTMTDPLQRDNLSILLSGICIN